MRDDEMLAAAHAAAIRVYPTQVTNRENVVSGARAVLTGHATLAKLGSEHAEAKAAAADAMDRLRGAVIAAALRGESEAAISRISGISRPTVRAILGK